MPEQSDDLPCQAQIGFLFKRTCGRMTRVGCPYCKGQPLPKSSDTWNSDYDPYFNQRSMYKGYGNYSSGSWGSNYHRYNFTDADSNAVRHERNANFEKDLDAS